MTAAVALVYLHAYEKESKRTIKRISMIGGYLTYYLIGLGVGTYFHFR